MMRRRIALLLAAALLIIAGAAGWFWYQWKHPRAVQGFWLPAGTEILGVVNTHRVIEEALGSKMNVKGDSTLLKRWVRESGIDVLTPFWVFGSKQKAFYGLAVKISDSLRLKQFLKTELQAVYQKKSGRYQVAENSFFLQGGLLYIFLKGSPVLENASGIGAGIIQRLEGNLGDTLLRGALLESPLSEWHGNPVFALWSDAESLRLIFHGFHMPESGIDTGSDVSLSLPLSWFRFWPDAKQQGLGMIKKQGLDTSGLLADKGLFNLALAGVVHHSTRSISYAYDEEFNRVEKVSWQVKHLPGLRMSATCRNSGWYTQTKSDSQPGQMKFRNLFGWPCGIENKQSFAIVQVAGKSESRREATTVPGLFYLNTARLQKTLKQTVFPWAVPEGMLCSEISALPTETGLQLQLKYPSMGRPVWQLLAADIQRLMKSKGKQKQ